MPGFISNHPRARELIRVGNEAIAKQNDVMLRAYFSEDYIFHGPGGDLSFDELSSYFASLRAAFSDFKIVRDQILVEGDYLAARNIFSGVFKNVFTQSPIGAVQPSGKYVEWEAINTFRYDGTEQLAEEWVQTDYRSLLVKLGAEKA
jgi:predicted ester cyclase